MKREIHTQGYGQWRGKLAFDPLKLVVAYFFQTNPVETFIISWWKKSFGVTLSHLLWSFTITYHLLLLKRKSSNSPMNGLRTDRQKAYHVFFFKCVFHHLYYRCYQSYHIPSLNLARNPNIALSRSLIGTWLPEVGCKTTKLTHYPLVWGTYESIPKHVRTHN